MSSEFTLEDKFPDMKPVKGPPPLFRLKGCGVGIYGSRDHDPDTLTYVTTYCLCLIFIPVLALRAYRIANAPNGGWYFLGRVPLSSFAKAWNVVLVGILLCLGGFLTWNNHINSPDYLARQELAEADGYAATGQIGKAAQEYGHLALGDTDQAGVAMARLRDLLDEPADQATPTEVALVLQVAVQLKDRPGAVPNLLDRGLELADQRAQADPKGALQIVEAVAPLASADRLHNTRLPLLERLVVQEPENLEFASQLAVIYEATDQLAKCETLLGPHRQRLGTTEGARILGQILVRQGKFDEAYALLLPYTAGRLQKLHAAENSLGEAFKSAEQDILTELNKGNAPGFAYQTYDHANKAQQEDLVDQYIQSRIKDDPGIMAAQEAVRKETDVVPVALDLGIVLLRRGQSLDDPAARRAELEKAEKTFLAVRGVAGKSDQYRLFLGQVYYWLGKHAEGRKLFDELLEAQHRNTDSLLAVSRTLREVGASAEARLLAEEAFGKETDPKKKYEAASIRALLFIDLDDDITWLGRSNPDDPETQASLHASQSAKAEREGKNQEAVNHLHQAIAIYQRQTETSSTLNNGALAQLALFRLTGERAAFDSCLLMLDKAVALEPGNSILLYNASTALLESAIRDLIGTSIDLKVLKANASFDLVPYLYQNQAGKEPYVQRLRSHPAVIKAVAYLERVLVLAPKRQETYLLLQTIYHYTRDLDGLKGLKRRLEGVDLDLSDSDRLTLDFLAGKGDDKFRAEQEQAIEHSQGIVQAFRGSAQKRTFAVAAAQLAQDKVRLRELGQPGNPDEVVALAEEAQAAAPSSATAATLTAALLHRANLNLFRQQPDFASLMTRAKRSLGPTYLPAVALSREGPLRTACLADKDVQQAMTLILETRRQFPDHPDEWSWAMLRAAHPNEAALAAKVYLGDEKNSVERWLGLKLSPVNPSTAMEAYWAMEMANKEEEGRAILQSFAARGVPLPVDSK